MSIAVIEAGLVKLVTGRITKTRKFRPPGRFLVAILPRFTFFVDVLRKTQYSVAREL